MRIPRRNTKSHEIYKLLEQNYTPARTAKTLKMSVNSVRVLIWKMRRPKTANARAYLYYHFGTSSVQKLIDRKAIRVD